MLEAAIGDEDTLDEREKRGLDQAAFVVAGFGPGVGEVDVQDGDARIGDEFGEKEIGLGADGAGVDAVVAAQAIRGVTPEPAGPFDAEEVGIRARLGLVEKKSPFADADFDFNGVGVCEEGCEIERAREGIDIEADGFDDQGTLRVHRGDL